MGLLPLAATSRAITLTPFEIPGWTTKSSSLRLDLEHPFGGQLRDALVGSESEPLIQDWLSLRFVLILQDPVEHCWILVVPATMTPGSQSPSSPLRLSDSPVRSTTLPVGVEWRGSQSCVFSKPSLQLR